MLGEKVTKKSTVHVSYVVYEKAYTQMKNELIAMGLVEDDSYGEQ